DQGDREEAVELLGALAQRAPRDGDLLRVRAQLELSKNSPQGKVAARDMARQALASAAPDPPTFVGLARASLMVGDHATAVALADRALQFAPDDTGLLVVRSQAALQLGDYESAERYAQNAIAAGTFDADAAEVLLETARRRGDGPALQRLLDTLP